MTTFDGLALEAATWKPPFSSGLPNSIINRFVADASRLPQNQQGFDIFPCTSLLGRHAVRPTVGSMRQAPKARKKEAK